MKGKTFFLLFILYEKNFFKHLCFISMYGVLSTLSEYMYFYISKNISSYNFLLVFEIIESFQCVLKKLNITVPKKGIILFTVNLLKNAETVAIFDINGCE